MYPTNELVLIAPILFIVLMVAFPVIGVFGGWKRAAFWGGGNFLFYSIGLLAWHFAGGPIASAIQPLLESLTQQLGATIKPELISAIVSPVFFILVFMLGNLILLINYYAWYKRVVGLKKYKVEKKKNKDGQIVKTKVQVQHNYSTGYKVMNKVVGGVGMTALMLPSVFTLTQATFMATTSPVTRKTNAFAEGLYNGLMSANEKINWFSYYEVDTPQHFDSAFTAITLLTGEVTIEYEGAEGGQITGTPLEVAETLLAEGMHDITEITSKEGGPTKSEVVEAINGFTENWNILTDNDTMRTCFEQLLSDDMATEMMDQFIESQIPAGYNVTIDENNYESYIDTFDTFVDGYVAGKINVGTEEEPVWKEFTQIEQINTTQTSFENIENVVQKLIKTDTLTEEQQKTINGKINTLLQIVLNPVK